MAKTKPWQDEYWLPLVQLYLMKPVGVKPTFWRAAVELSMELHVEPRVLHQRLEQVARLSTPRLEHLWQLYGSDQKRLARAVRLWREMRGFGMASEFYQGVEINETFEKDFRPLPEDGRFLPIALIIILSLYFQLVPQTMVTQTPEVAELAKLLKVAAADVVQVLMLYQLCDPYLNRSEISLSPLLLPCQKVWERFEGYDTNKLAFLAEELKEYYR